MSIKENLLTEKPVETFCLTGLIIEGFRNYRHVSIEPGRGFHVFAGPNAQGKTNLLEAIYLLSTTRMLRGMRDIEAIREGEDRFRVEGLIAEGRTSLSMTLERGGRKRGLLNGVGLTRAADLIGRLPSVCITALDLPMADRPRDGKPIAGLKAQNFVIFEDGKKQQIERFAATAAPMEVALLLDTSGSTRVELTLIRQAAANFIAGLRPGDRVAIAAFRTVESDGRRMSSVEVLTPMTGDRAAAAAALAAIGNSFGTPLYDGMLKLGQAVFTEPPTPEFRMNFSLLSTPQACSYSLTGT